MRAWLPQFLHIVPETVEKQLVDLAKILQDNQAQQQTLNQRLIGNLQQIYQVYQASPEGLKRGRQQLFEHLEGKVTPSVKPTNLPDDHVFDRKHTRGVISSRNRKTWSPRLVAAILLLAILGVGVLAFTYSRFHVSFSSIQPGSASLNISIEPQPFLYQNDLYVNTGNDIRTYAAQNGVPERIYALANTTSNPTIINGVLYISGQTSVFAMRLSDGKLLWQAPFGSETSHSPTIVNGVLYGYAYVSSDIVFYALQSSNGHLLWQYHISN